MYLAFAMERAHPATSVADLLDDELEVILGKVATELRSPKQLMALSALSRRFRRLVRQPAVWRELDVSQHRAYMTDSLLLRQIVRNDGAFSLLRRVDFSGCTRVTDAAIRKVLALSGTTLTHLHLEGCALLTTELARYAATACPNLEVLDLTACASVDTLEVLRLSDEDWPRMRELELMDTGALAGRVPQETFERLHAALAERRERFAEQKKAEAEAAERAADDASLPIGGPVPASAQTPVAPSDDAPPSGDAAAEDAALREARELLTQVEQDTEEARYREAIGAARLQGLHEVCAAPFDLRLVRRVSCVGPPLRIEPPQPPTRNRSTGAARAHVTTTTALALKELN